jgi:hypothetical protein
MFSHEQQKLIYNAIRYYQINRVAHNSKEYGICDDILNNLFDKVYTQTKEQQR